MWPTILFVMGTLFGVFITGIVGGASTPESKSWQVTGVGGVFFKASDPDALRLVCPAFGVRTRCRRDDPVLVGGGKFQEPGLHRVEPLLRGRPVLRAQY